VLVANGDAGQITAFMLSSRPSSGRARKPGDIDTDVAPSHQFARAVLDISVLQADELPAQAESIGA